MIISAILFGFIYYAVEKAGIFSAYPKTDIEILYSFPILFVSLAIMLIIAVSAFRKVKSLSAWDWLGVASIILIVSGLWLGHFTRFSAEVVLTEGQDFYTGHADYLPGTFYRGIFSKPPDFSIRIENLSPSFSDDGTSLSKLKGKIRFFSPKSKEPVEYVFTDGLPKLIEGTMFRLNDFGYSPRYALKSKEGKVLDSSFVFMDLFPPGSEGYFRLLSPLTYYIRYFPDGKDDINEALLQVRIVRNKDVIMNRDVKISEDITFENNRMSFEEVRMWTKLSIKRDWGEAATFGGFCIGFVYLAVRFFTCRKQ